MKQIKTLLNIIEVKTSFCYNFHLIPKKVGGVVGSVGLSKNLGKSWAKLTILKKTSGDF